MISLVLRGGRVFDAAAGTFRSGLDVALAGGRIAAIGADLQVDPSARIVELDGAYLLPGLIDAHYHLVSRSDVRLSEREIAMSMLEGVANARDCVASGVTTVRDCGCRHEGIYALRQAIGAGLVPGPGAHVAGRNPTGSLAPAHWRNVVVRGEEQMRQAVRDQHAAGADWVKLILAHAEEPSDWSRVTSFLSDAEIAAAVDEAHALGISIGGHCEGWDVAARAVALGLDSLDHAPLVSAETAEAMAARGVFYTPTVWAFSDDSGVEGMPAAEADALAAWQQEHRDSVRRALAAGVPIAAGSDAAGAVTGRGVLLKEMSALERCGLTPAEALRAATETAASLIGASGRLGAIGVGADADLVVLREDPLVSLSALAEPERVYLKGRLGYDRVRGFAQSDSLGAVEAATTRRWAA